uniref:Uncharacterized protein n=1 Tax=viral metagenome TaxID=1070528 RepID=A0A6C0H8Y9_9ZZZZ
MGEAIVQVRTDFPININESNFPHSDNIRNIIYNHQFNKLLQHIKTEIINCTSTNLNNNNIKFNLVTIALYPPEIINDVKNYLKTKNYKNVDIEDAQGNVVGWKLYW